MATAARERLARMFRGDVKSASSVELTARPDDLRLEVDGPAALATDGTIVLAPEHRASFVVRQLLGRMLKPVQADVVVEEVLTLEASDLYYRPIWAFEFHWAPKDKTGVLEIDGLTGQVHQAASLTSSKSFPAIARSNISVAMESRCSACCGPQREKNIP